MPRQPSLSAESLCGGHRWSSYQECGRNSTVLPRSIPEGPSRKDNYAVPGLGHSGLWKELYGRWVEISLFILLWCYYLRHGLTI